jgi:hypothetical protein
MRLLCRNEYGLWRPLALALVSLALALMLISPLFLPLALAPILALY